MAKPKLVYFALRGRAEVIRLALAEAGVDWDDDTFNAGDEFSALKESGRLPFKQAPVWEEEGLRLAQSGAILNHVARANGLYGKSPREAALIDQALGAIEDVRSEYRKLYTGEKEKRAAVRSDLVGSVLPRWFGMLEKLLAGNQDGKGFLVGDSISHADLALYYALEMAVDNDLGGALADCPRLLAFKERIATRPKIASYLASKRRFPLLKIPVS